MHITATGVMGSTEGITTTVQNVLRLACEEHG
jgi:hypothetical protein